MRPEQRVEVFAAYCSQRRVVADDRVLADIPIVLETGRRRQHQHRAVGVLDGDGAVFDHDLSAFGNDLEPRLELQAVGFHLT